MSVEDECTWQVRSLLRPTTFALLLAASWACLALWSWIDGYGPITGRALLHPLGVLVPLWALAPPSLYLAVCLARPRWVVVLLGSLPSILWGAPQYARLIVDESTIFSLPGVYLDYVSYRLVVGTAAALVLGTVAEMATRLSDRGSAHHLAASPSD